MTTRKPIDPLTLPPLTYRRGDPIPTDRFLAPLEPLSGLQAHERQEDGTYKTTTFESRVQGIGRVGSECADRISDKTVPAAERFEFMVRTADEMLLDVPTAMVEKMDAATLELVVRYCARQLDEVRAVLAVEDGLADAVVDGVAVVPEGNGMAAAPETLTTATASPSRSAAAPSASAPPSPGGRAAVSAM
jgi:hypothetical protein